MYFIAFDCLDLVAHRSIILAVTSSISSPGFWTKDQWNYVVMYVCMYVCMKSWVSSGTKDSATGRDFEAFHRSREAHANVNQRITMYLRLLNNWGLSFNARTGGHLWVVYLVQWLCVGFVRSFLKQLAHSVSGTRWAVRNLMYFAFAVCLSTSLKPISHTLWILQQEPKIPCVQSLIIFL
jgi:hypothetical protein